MTYSYFPHRAPRKGNILRHPASSAMSAGLYSNPIARLTAETVQELSWRPAKDKLRGKDFKKHTLDDYAEVLLLDEVIKFCFKLVELRAREAFGTYSHGDEKITEFIRGTIADMDGTLEEFVGIACAIAFYFGFFTAEIGWKYNTPGFHRQMRLKQLLPHSPLTTRFKGNRDGLFWVVDRSGGGKAIEIPYQKCIHLVNRDPVDPTSPYGNGAGATTVGLFKAKRTCLSEWIVAGKNQSSGLWIVQANTSDSVVLTDHNGRALQENGRDRVVSAIENARSQLEDFDKNNFLVMDKAYTINWQAMPTDTAFFQTVLDGIDRRLFMSMNVPYLVANEGVGGGFGYSGVASLQSINLDSQISAIVKQVRDQILEKIVKPLLFRNFALKPKQGWGKFDVEKTNDPGQAGAKIQNILAAVGAGALPLDNSVSNMLRDLLGLPNQTEEERLLAIQKAVEVQQAQQNGGQQPAEPTPNGDEAAKQNYP